MEISTFDINPSTNIMETLAHSGYNIETAIADIIDNSIAAGAKNVKISLNVDDNESIDKWYIDICDDGRGMDSATLEAALRMADRSMSEERNLNDLGRYGVGLKTASISQANKLTVISKTNHSQLTVKGIDMDDLKKSNKWLGFSYEDRKYQDEFNKMVGGNHGTIVRWEKLKFTSKDKVTSKEKNALYNKLDTIEKYLGMVFHRFIENNQLAIMIGNREIEAWDPFCSKIIATNNFDTQILKYEMPNKKNEYINITIKSYLIPVKNTCSVEEFDKITRGNALGYQGFYVYRNNRIIIGGGWLNSKKIKAHQSLNNLRISIDFDSRLDEFFNVGFTKASVDFPDDFRKEIERIALNGKKEVNAKLKEKTRRATNPTKKVETMLWIEKIKSNELSYKINDEHPLIQKYTKDMSKEDKKKLFALLESNCPRIHLVDINKKVFYDEKTLREQLEDYIDVEIAKSKGKYKLDKKKFYEELLVKCINLSPFDEHKEFVQIYFDNEVKNDR